MASPVQPEIPVNQLMPVLPLRYVPSSSIQRSILQGKRSGYSSLRCSYKLHHSSQHTIEGRVKFERKGRDKRQISVYPVEEAAK